MKSISVKHYCQAWLGRCLISFYRNSMRETAPQSASIIAPRQKEHFSLLDTTRKGIQVLLLAAAGLGMVQNVVADTNQPTFNASKLYAEGRKEASEGRKEADRASQKLAEIRRKKAELQAQLAALEAGK